MAFGCSHGTGARKQSLKVRLALKMPFRLYDFNQGEGCSFNKKIAIVIAVPLVIIILLIIIFTVLRHVNPELLEDLNNRSKNKRQWVWLKSQVFNVDNKGLMFSIIKECYCRCTLAFTFIMVKEEKL